MGTVYCSTSDFFNKTLVPIERLCWFEHARYATFLRLSKNTLKHREYISYIYQDTQGGPCVVTLGNEMLHDALMIAHRNTSTRIRFAIDNC